MKTGAVAITAPRDRLADFVALTKPRLNSLVVVTTGVGYLAGRVEGFDPVVFAHTTVGAALVAGGAAALNQIAERDLDERMLRTRDRPIPAGRLHPAEATWVAGLLAVAGLAQLAFGANLTAAVVAFVTLVSYAGIYTPSKRWTHWALLVGAVPGALPVVIGWAAAGPLSADAWALFALAFVSCQIVYPTLEVTFRRGDSNGDGMIDIADPVGLLQHLFTGGAAPICLDSGDSDDNGSVDIADAVLLLSHLFIDGVPPAAPWPDCGLDPVDDALECAASTGGCL